MRRLVCPCEDVLAVLPSGFRKSIICQIIPKVWLCLVQKSKETKSFVVCNVSLLQYIRKQQVKRIKKLDCGSRAAPTAIRDEMDKGTKERHVNIVFGSAEQWLRDRWKKALQVGRLYDSKILVVDQVHTVETC